MKQVTYGCVRQRLRGLTKEEFLILKDLCHVAKNLRNEALYCIRQYFFQTGKYLSYTKVYNLLKHSPNYKTLNSNMAQQIVKDVDQDFHSFFALLKLAKQGKYEYSAIHIPHYLPKDGYTSLIIGFIRISENHFILPYSQSYRKNHKPLTVTVPDILKDKTIREIRILPKAGVRAFELQYIYVQESEEMQLNPDHALSIDIGIGNLMTCVTNKGKSFIIDGKYLKSLNQWFNKENARLQSMKDLAKINGTTKRQDQLWDRRERCINDAVNKACRYVINYCLTKDIGTLVVGCNKDFQRGSNLGKQTNQNFVNLPVGRIRERLKVLSKRYNIRYIEQEESYTSKASFFDQDVIPVYQEGQKNNTTFSGTRIHRGLYQTKDGYQFNADVNGALNILKKSSVVCLNALYSRGAVDTPLRVRIR